jgi:DNA recombination protein RmuC
LLAATLILASVTVIAVVASCAMILSHIGRFEKSLAAIDTHMEPIDGAMPALRDLGCHVRDAKDGIVKLGSDFGELRGRVAGLGTMQAQAGDTAMALQSLVPLQIGDGIRHITETLTCQEVRFRAETGETLDRIRVELAATLETSAQAQERKLEDLRGTIDSKLSEIVTRTGESARLANETSRTVMTTMMDRLAELRTTVDAALKQELGAIREGNATKLEEIRRTVDEKLHATLETRLGESFKLVSDRLEQVHRGLGEMQTLATGVGDLKKVLTNVKTRGCFGEIQLGALLEQILSIDQFERNVMPIPGRGAVVEFAIKLPGRRDGAVVWLPIDAKFPVEDYQRLGEAQDRADVSAIAEAVKALENRLKNEAKRIQSKYLEPPHTTDFAIMFLPTEGLYAEALRRPGLVEWLQRECKVILAGPTTLAALLNSLQMGFRTLAIEKRSAEVWTLLGTVKFEFGKFGEALAHTKKKLTEATNSILSAEQRNRVLTRKLDGVAVLPASESAELAQLPRMLESAPEVADDEETGGRT